MGLTRDLGAWWRWSGRIVSLLASLVILTATGPNDGGAGAETSQSVPAARQARNVAIITIKGQINSVTASSFERRLKLAERAGADALVVELDTPGGELGAVLDISNMIKGSAIGNTVAWVHDEAYSGGAVIALACDEIVNSDPATMGDALVISVSFGMLNQLPEQERQKFLTPLIADMVDSARRNGYDEYLVQGIASLGVELWYVEDTRTGRRFCVNEREYRMLFDEEPPSMRPRLASAPARTDGASAPPPPVDPAQPPPTAEPAPPRPDVPEDIEYEPASESLQDLESEVSNLQEVPSRRPRLSPADAGHFRLVPGGGYVSDGSGPVVLKAADLAFYGFSSGVVETDEDLKAFFGAEHLRRLNPEWSESLASALIILTNPLVKGVLIIVFLVGLFLELSSPGLTVPGAVAVAALVAFLAPPMLVGMAGWWEVAAVLLGIGLMGLELFVIPGFGVAGVTGLVLLMAGMVGTFVPAGQGGLFPDSPDSRNDLMYGIATVVLAVVTSGVLMFFLARNFSRLPVVSTLVLRAPSREDRGEADSFLSAMGPPESSGVGIGSVGKTITPLRPIGQAQFGDEIVDVGSELGFLGAGVTVRVVEIGDLGRYLVEQVEPEDVTGEGREGEGTEGDRPA